MNPSRDSVAQVRHTIRTPLNHIIGYSEMLLEERGDSATDEFARHVRHIQSTGLGLLSLLQTTIEAEDDNASPSFDAFGEQIAGPIYELVKSVGGAMQVAPAAALPDVFRIVGAAAELLEFIDRSAPVLTTTIPPISGEAKASVLAIDDDEANRDILQRQLQRFGFDVVSAASGREGLLELERQNFDIVLVDLMMPGMDGLEVLQAIKGNPATRNVPVLIVSAMDELADVSRSIERGADDYLFRPFDPVLLTARISAALERTRLRQRERERANQLERIGHELRRSNEDLQRFAYAVSHDLQAPLRTITTHLQLLERHVGHRLSPEDLELIRFPVDAALRMGQLIRNLLAYSQASTEEHVLTPVSCEEVLAATLDDLASEIEESHATITHDVLPTVLADPVQLRQLFLNLIGNAIKYRGKNPPNIHAGAKHENKFWHFCVSDNGVGIPAQHIRDVFKLFRRLHGQERPGTGMGLAICKRIMERLGGEIWVESEEGAGSTFHFTIPIGN